MSRCLGHLGNNDLLLRARSFLFKKASELRRYCMLGELILSSEVLSVVFVVM